MKALSWEHYGLRGTRILLLAGVVSLAVGFAFRLGTADVLGSNATELSALFSGTVFYIVLSAPKRALDSTALSQAREAATLAAAGSANFEATHSRTRSVLMLDASERELASILDETKRRLLLGFGVVNLMATAADEAVSQSVKDVFSSVAHLDPTSIEERGEESENISHATELSEESKLPLFMAVAFFTPIMLTLLAVLSHVSDPKSFAELVLVQLVVTDIAFYVSSAEKGRLST